MASVEFSDVRELPPVERENNSVEPATQSDARRTFWSQKRIPTLLRASSLLFAGMLLGALLAFFWFFAQSKNRGAGHNLKETRVPEYAKPGANRLINVLHDK